MQVAQHRQPKLSRRRAVGFYVPRTFWDDFEDRAPVDDEAHMPQRRGTFGKRVLISANSVQMAALKADATFYAEGNVDDASSLIRSAKATLAAIAKAEAE